MTCDPCRLRVRNQYSGVAGNPSQTLSSLTLEWLVIQTDPYQSEVTGDPSRFRVHNQYSGVASDPRLFRVHFNRVE